MANTPSRAEQLAALRAGQRWDVLVIGGGASGLGAAVDAAARGYSTLLLERGDYASGTSSRSTKLIHGGVRYLRQGDLGLVRHALIERRRLLANAGHLVHPLPFVIPARSAWQRLYYGSGLKLYDLLAGASNLAPSRLLDRRQTLAALPGLSPHGLSGGVQYWDGQFDDARLAIALLRTASDLGATCLNYLPVSGLLSAGGKVCGVVAEDGESGERFELSAKVVINATGVYVDAVRRFEAPAASPVLMPSQGIHLVLDAAFLPGETALLIPETADGRVMFAIPWQGKVLLGTTDTERHDLPDEPQPFAGEVDFLLQTAVGVLAQAPQRADIRSAFAGLRPLLHPDNEGKGGTAALSREHAVLVSTGGLVTVAGGKWTTYRLMAEQVVDRAAAVGQLPAVPCTTARLKLHGWNGLASGPYGADAPLLAALPGHDRLLHPDLTLTEAMVRFALRHEGARTIEDILARRHRALFLDARAAAACIAPVGEIVAEELGLSAERLAALVRQAGQRAGQFLLDGGAPAGTQR
ncbi:glycerol-3-phosphate dehydrogenase/oxidase [Dechloromonas denitrificans]|uniref:glycerol-3-phosphate dehydrogenase/oxidase n=1 Tax=Dechloromonas denitrificans TaxID=281362 RepID=UPI001CFB25CD|nr:glycerol-3-phosphate dehydrogenase/oxidase [Dechloromonas denitrificans]UCV06422.1 glycerol-3-phosphate dehydrogenase/oxidase [Dechloromonas denitrificans]